MRDDVFGSLEPLQEGESLILYADDPIPLYSHVCTYCDHWHVGPGRKCSAFPDGIPLPIWLGKHRHRRAYAGDRGIRFDDKRLTRA